MKLIEIKEKAFQLTGTSNTKQLKQEYLSLTIGKDLRRKEEWIILFEQIKLLQPRKPDMAISDLNELERTLKESMFTIGSVSGLDDDSLTISWQRIRLESQFSDIHIEEL